MNQKSKSSWLQPLDTSIELSGLNKIGRGIEKEGLRIDSNGSIAQTGHPAILGSTLTHPSITTDYSEALLEFITPKISDPRDAIGYLEKLHAFTSEHLSKEAIWPASMPCGLHGEESIPIARYGTSNVGQLKHVYRRGLWFRYGRIMQSIAGLHYNFSFSDSFWKTYLEHCGSAKKLQDFKSEQYFHLLCNYRAHSWLLLYLFGASPVVDESFFEGRSTHLQHLGKLTWGLPYATSLRMSDLGYQNNAQQGLHVCYDSLDSYASTLGVAIKQPHPPYEKIGVKVEDDYNQLNTNILQLENEYYSDIRPKRVTQSGEKPIHALKERGVEYIEVRILDLDPFHHVGIREEQIRFLDSFLLFCLLNTCRRSSDAEREELNINKQTVVNEGRKPGVELKIGTKNVALKQAGHEILDQVMQAAKLLDEAYGESSYTQAVASQQAKVDDPDKTPSARVMDSVSDSTSFVEDMLARAHQYKKDYRRMLRSRDHAELLHVGRKSLVEQWAREDADKISFDEYLAQYNRS